MNTYAFFSKEYGQYFNTAVINFSKKKKRKKYLFLWVPTHNFLGRQLLFIVNINYNGIKNIIKLK